MLAVVNEQADLKLQRGPAVNAGKRRAVEARCAGYGVGFNVARP